MTAAILTFYVQRPRPGSNEGVFLPSRAGESITTAIARYRLRHQDRSASATRAKPRAGCHGVGTTWVA